MAFYPLFLDLAGRACLVAGAGAVGRRKTAALIDASPKLIRLVDPAPPHEEEKRLAAKAHAANVTLLREERPFSPTDLDGCALAFAATGDKAVNRHIAALCRERDVLCNVADTPDLSDFLAPAAWRQANLQVAVSTCGASPALAGHIRDELAVFLDGRYSVLTQLLECLRPRLASLGFNAMQNKELFLKLMDAGLPTALQVRDHARAGAILYEFLPNETHADIETFLRTLTAGAGRILQ